MFSYVNTFTYIFSYMYNHNFMIATYLILLIHVYTYSYMINISITMYVYIYIYIYIYIYTWILLHGVISYATDIGRDQFHLKSRINSFSFESISELPVPITFEESNIKK